MMQPHVEAKNIALTVSRRGEETSACADPTRITEVVCRMLTNAVQFTPAGGRIQIGVDTRDDLIELSVGDSGPGIRPEDRQRVFERFSQIGDVMTGKPKGAGLGLAICQRIVDAMGGTMWCDESPLGGAMFRFVLPRAQTIARR